MDAVDPQRTSSANLLDHVAQITSRSGLLIIRKAESSDSWLDTLQLPFRDALIVRVGDDGARNTLSYVAPVDQPRAVVVESCANDIRWALQVVSAISEECASGAYIVIAFHPDEKGHYGNYDHGLDSVPLTDDLRVAGLGRIDQAVCVILSMGTECGWNCRPVAPVLVTAAHAVQLQADVDENKFHERLAPDHHELQARSRLTIKRIESDLNRLSNELAIERTRREAVDRKYASLRNSRLGKVTVRYRQLRRLLRR